MNNEFLNTAFSESAIDLIEDTSIIPDCFSFNSEISYNVDYNQDLHYYLDQYSITSKIFLLNYDEVLNLHLFQYDDDNYCLVNSIMVTSYVENSFSPPTCYTLPYALSSSGYDEYSNYFYCVTSPINSYPFFSYGRMDDLFLILPALSIFIEN